MKDIIKTFDNFPLIVKIILALPVLDICWAIYRLCRSIDKKNTLGIVLGVLMLFFCPAIVWVLDIITLLVMGKVIWID